MSQNIYGWGNIFMRPKKLNTEVISMLSDSNIIKLFFERSEAAITELSKKYGNSCRKLAFNILRNNEDVEEVINDSYLGVWNAVPPKVPDPLVSYLLRIVKNLSIKRYRYNSAQKRFDGLTACFDDFEDYFSDNDLTENRFEVKQISRYIDEFIETLSESNRMLFVRRYWYGDSFANIAEILGVSETAVRKRLSRIRGDLREFFIKRGIMQ